MSGMTAKTILLLLLVAFTGGSQAVSPLFTQVDEGLPYFVMEMEFECDTDEVEESSASALVAISCRSDQLDGTCVFQNNRNDVNQLTDSLLIHEHAARAPPLG